MELNLREINTPFTINDYDEPIRNIVNYVEKNSDFSRASYEAARICFFDSIACAYMALQNEACVARLGSYVPNTKVQHGVSVPGTSMLLDPVRAAFNFTACIRWLDYNDTWLAAEWGHPSDNLGAIWSAASFKNSHDRTVSMRELLDGMIKSYEIQGVFALENSFNRCGLDHVVLVKVASSAVLTQMLGGRTEHILSAVSNAWIDGQSLRTYRHGINTGPRKSWAAADAVMRAFNLGWLALYSGEPGYPQALSAKGWGFYDVLFKGNKFSINQELDSYVMDNILLKVSFPAEFHAQTAAECGIALHNIVKDRFAEIKSIKVRTQEAAMRIINKPQKLTNYADRDHCLQYILAVALFSGEITSESYSDEFAACNPEIEILREKMILEEDKQYSADYMDPNRRSIANAVRIEFKDGSSTNWKEVEYPIGHKRRRDEAMPKIKEKLISALDMHNLSDEKKDGMLNLWELPIEEFLNIPMQEMIELCQS